MSQPRLRPRTRKRTETNSHTEKPERKRKARPSVTEDDNHNFKKRTSLPPAVEDMTLQSDEVISDIEDDGHLCIKTHEKRRRSIRAVGTTRTNELKKCVLTQQQNNKNSQIKNLQNDLINGITRFTFSNYFSPISKDDSPLPHLAWADSHEVWETMLQKDRDYKRDPLYLRKHPQIQPRMRTVLLDWLIEVCEVYRLHRETFYLAVDYVDRFLSSQKNIPKTRLQLVGVTAIFIAAKMEEIYPPKLSEFAFVTDGACTSDEILQQECLLLAALNWRLCPVTPISWLTAYLQIANRKLKSYAKNEIDENFHLPQFNGVHLARVTELIDICCLDTGFLQFSYSILAASALYHMWGKDVTDVTGHEFEELYPCIQWMSPFAHVVQTQPIKPIKCFDNISTDNAHNIQTHTSAIKLLDYAHSQMSTAPLNNLQRTSPLVKCKGILTPPKSTEKDLL